jgi:hypothetical protein
LRKKSGGIFGFGSQNYPGSILIQPVNQQRPRRIFFTKDTVQRDPYPFAALDCKACGFVKDEAGFIFKENSDAFQLHPFFYR